MSKSWRSSKITVKEQTNIIIGKESSFNFLGTG